MNGRLSKARARSRRSGRPRRPAARHLGTAPSAGYASARTGGAAGATASSSRPLHAREPPTERYRLAVSPRHQGRPEILRFQGRDGARLAPRAGDAAAQGQASRVPCRCLTSGLSLTVGMEPELQGKEAQA
jgi:hypothetical protein